MGGDLINLGGCTKPWARLEYSEGRLLQVKATKLAWASWAATTSLIFAIKWRERLRKKGSASLALIIHLKLVRKRKKEKYPSRYASVTLP